APAGVGPRGTPQPAQCGGLADGVRRPAAGAAATARAGSARAALGGPVVRHAAVARAGIRAPVSQRGRGPAAACAAEPDAWALAVGAACARALLEHPVQSVPMSPAELAQQAEGA